MRPRRIMLMTVALVGILLAIGSSVTADADWRRCVTQPTADGSRLTFLYPGALQQKMDAGSHWMLARPQSFLGRFRRSFSPGFSTSTDGEFISVRCWPADFGLPPGKTETLHRYGCGNGGPPRGWDVTLQDGAKGPFYDLHYRLNDEEPCSFEKRSSLVARSLKVLHRGDPVPADYPVMQGPTLVDYTTPP